MRAPSLAPLLAGLAIGAAGAQEPPDVPPDTSARVSYDHYDPVALDQLARERLRQGDTMTACILVARAARLAPYDRRVARNLQELEASPAAAIAPPASLRLTAVLGTAPDIPPEPPPLWPAK